MKNAVMAAVIAFLVVFLLWFVLFMPAPDYMPEYGSDPRDIPHQMMD